MSASTHEYKIRNVGTETYLDMYNGTPEGPVVGWIGDASNPNPHQRWIVTVQDAEKRIVTIKNVTSQTYAYVPDLVPHQQVIGGPSSSFELVEVSPGRYNIKVEARLAFSLASSDSNTPVRLDSPENANQEWIFENLWLPTSD